MNKVFIIAEAGVNHNGSIELAKDMIVKAYEAGVDAIKFQSFKASKLVTKDAQMAKYQQNNIGVHDFQYNMLKKLEMNNEMFFELAKFSKRTGIQFLSSPFDMESIDLLQSIGMDIYKIPSGEINNLPYLRRIGSLGKKVVLSTGMSTMEEIGTAVNILRLNGTADITILHCNTEYPTPMEDVNLNAMLTIKNTLNVNIGYSDHTLGIEVPIAAVALGAQVVEKHFTLDKTMEGPDHRASLNPEELKKMVQCIRNIEVAMGDGAKKPSLSEEKNIVAARKSIIAATHIKKGEVFSEENLITKRPGNGMSPMLWDEVIGKIAKQDFNEDEMIEL